jgi:hypothetical protein
MNMKSSKLVSVALVVVLQCAVSGAQASFIDELKDDALDALDVTKQKAGEVVGVAPEMVEEIAEKAVDVVKEVFDETKSKGLELLERLERLDRETTADEDDSIRKSI